MNWSVVGHSSTLQTMFHIDHKFLITYDSSYERDVPLLLKNETSHLSDGQTIIVATQINEKS